MCAAAAAILLLFALAPAAPAHVGHTETFLNTEPFALAEQFQAAVEPALEPVPRAVCGPGAREETGIQGRVSRADHESGLAAQGLQCNAELVGQHTQEKAGQDGTIVGSVGGYKVLRYEDDLGNQCAYYDTSLLPPTNLGDLNLGVRVLNMNDPSNPQLTGVLTTPAMSFPHESLILSEERGLLMAVAGNLSQTILPGQVDIYDINNPTTGCQVPILMSSTPLGIWGHESGIAPDGNTFYASSLSNETVTALDISNPMLPQLLVHQPDVAAHGLSISDDGNTAYVARGQSDNGFEIYDVSSIQNREPNPQMEHVSKLTWQQMSVPQSTVPITIDGHPFVIESDEFLREGGDVTGASRIIDIADPANPFVVSNLRLEVHQKENRVNGQLEDDPGVAGPFRFAQHYTGHFCNVPTREDPKIVACGMSVSGLRVFNIEDPYNPREVAYFTAPVQERQFPEGSNWAYSQPAFDVANKTIWYSEAYTGFYAVRLTNGAWPDDATEPDADEDGVDDAPAGPDGGATPQSANCQGSQAKLAEGSDARESLPGGPGRDLIRGFGGKDSISGLGLGDCLFGMDGADTVKGGPGSDRAQGNKGPDNVKGNGGDDDVRGQAGDDEVKGNGGRDVVRGGTGNDKLRGDEGSDTLKGSGGEDRLRAGAARDRMHAGGGADKVNAVDGKRDRVNCGTGKDRATADAEDMVENCERVRVVG